MSDEQPEPLPQYMSYQDPKHAQKEPPQGYLWFVLPTVVTSLANIFGGGGGETVILACKLCGAAVIGAEVHTRYHEDHGEHWVEPMDTPPTDHGSDRYDYVEVQNAPEGVAPPEAFLEGLTSTPPCPDCRANLFIRYGEPDPIWPKPQAITLDGHQWFIAVAHDDTCPTLAKKEREQQG